MKKGDAERDAGPDETFLQRWSREKSRARTEAGTDGSGTAVQPDAQAEPGAASDAGPVEPVELPSIDDLGPDSDYSAFMAPEVDSGLRRLALRKLFQSPKFNVLDGLDDYCDDFTQFPPLGAIVTADMRHQLERAAKAAMERLERATEPDVPSDAQVRVGRSENSTTPAVEGPETDVDDELA